MSSLVSIIVPVYNSEKYIYKCVDSLINQTYKNLEIILVNDGSKDNSPRICDEYVNKDKRIKVIHKENEGVSIARNVGIDNSNGEFIVFIDSDDYAEEIMIESAMSVIGQAEVAIWSYYIDSINDKEELTLARVVKLPDGNYRRELNTLEIDTNIVGCMGYVWNKIYRTDLIRSNNYKFKVDLSLGEDMVFNSEVLSSVNEIYFLNVPLIHYNQRERISLGTRYYNNYFSVKMTGFYSIKSLLNSWNISEQKIEEVCILLGFRLLKSTYRMISTAKEINNHERISYLNEVTSNQFTKAIICEFKPKSIKDKLLLFIMRTNNNRLISFLYKSLK